MTDLTNLIRQAQADDSEAFVALIGQYRQTLYKTAVAILKNEADAVDAVQDTVLSCYENLRSLREPKYFKTWLTRILINQCNRILKERKNLVPLHEHPELACRKPDTSVKEFLELLNLLKEPYRVVLYLFYVEEFSIREIAEILDMKENTVKTRLSRGRRCFQKLYIHENRTSLDPLICSPAETGSRKVRCKK